MADSHGPPSALRHSSIRGPPVAGYGQLHFSIGDSAAIQRSLLCDDWGNVREGTRWFRSAEPCMGNSRLASGSTNVSPLPFLFLDLADAPRVLWLRQAASVVDDRYAPARRGLWLEGARTRVQASPASEGFGIQDLVHGAVKCGVDKGYLGLAIDGRLT